MYAAIRIRDLGLDVVANPLSGKSGVYQPGKLRHLSKSRRASRGNCDVAGRGATDIYIKDNVVA